MQSGRPLSLNDENLRIAIETNSKLACRELASIFNVNKWIIKCVSLMFNMENSKNFSRQNQTYFSLILYLSEKESVGSNQWQ